MYGEYPVMVAVCDISFCHSIGKKTTKRNLRPTERENEILIFCLYGGIMLTC
jgi:hypothetical protein